MSSIDSKSNSRQSTIHQRLQIRTNKHRCFVFCLGHTSLTCVPGIGKKNKYLLNQSGIDNLSTLYRKYRSINNIQRFQRWLERDIGFTSYQAKMTTCGIGSKLGDIKEINTGLIPICCPAKERREEKQILLSKNRDVDKRNRSIELKEDTNKESKKRKIENIKLEELSPNSNRDRLASPQHDQIFNSSKEKILNKFSDEVKSPDNPIRSRSNPNKHSLEQKYNTNEISETKPMKLYSSLMLDEMIHDDTNLPKSTKQSHSSLDKSKISSSTSEQLNKSQTYDKTSLTIESSNISSEINSEIVKFDSNSYQQKKNEIQPNKLSTNHASSFDENKSLLPFNLDDFSNDKSPIDKRAINEMFDDQTKVDLSSSKTEKFNEIFTLKKQKLQPTLDALQDNKDEPLSASKYLLNTSITNEYSSKSIPSPDNTNVSFAAIKQKQYQQQTENRSLKTTSSFDTDSDKKFKSDQDTAYIKQSRFNEFQQEKLQEEVSKAVSQIMKQAARIVHDKIQSRAIGSMLTTKIKSNELASTQIRAGETDNDDGRSDQLSEQDSSTQKKKSVPFTADRLKQTSINTSSPDQINQFLHDKTTIKPNPNEKLESIQAQQALNNLSSTIHPNGNVIHNPELLSNTKIHNDRIQHEQPTLMTKLPITTNISPTTNKSSESMKTKPFNKKKSLSTLSSLSDSNQSINRIPSSIDKIQSTSSNIDRLDEETEIKTNHNSEKSNDIIVPPNSSKEQDNSLLTNSIGNNQFESISRSVTVSSPPNNHSKKDKSDAPVSQTLKENDVMNKNLSEIENFAHQSTSSPSIPIPCHALWDNISNEKILFQRKKPRFCFVKKSRSDQSGRNQNHHSSTTLFTDLTRQQYLKESENLDEHILYIKRIKTLYK